MKKLFIIIFSIVILLGITQTAEVQQVQQQNQMPPLCYLCGNRAGVYVQFELPSTFRKKANAGKYFRCIPFKVVICPRESNRARILGPVYEVMEVSAD